MGQHGLPTDYDGLKHFQPLPTDGMIQTDLRRFRNAENQTQNDAHQMLNSSIFDHGNRFNICDIETSVNNGMELALMTCFKYGKRLD